MKHASRWGPAPPSLSANPEILHRPALTGVRGDDMPAASGPRCRTAAPQHSPRSLPLSVNPKILHRQALTGVRDDDMPGPRCRTAAPQHSPRSPSSRLLVMRPRGDHAPPLIGAQTCVDLITTVTFPIRRCSDCRAARPHVALSPEIKRGHQRGQPWPVGLPLSEAFPSGTLHV